jgi:hypothetical protein
LLSAKVALLLRLGNPAVLALHRAEAADRECPQGILCAGARASPAGKLGAKAYRELVDSHAIAPGQYEVTKLVKYDQDGKHHEKRDHFLESDQSDDG